MPSLEGQVLIVTGSTQGVGEAIALESARLGAAGVVVCGRNAENGQRVAEEVAGIGAERIPIFKIISLFIFYHRHSALWTYSEPNFPGSRSRGRRSPKSRRNFSSVCLWDSSYSKGSASEKT